MAFDSVQVLAPSRLHFGMFSCGGPGARSFGGLGVMIDRPGVVVKARPADAWAFAGDLADRCQWFARRWAEQTPGATLAAMEVCSALDHVGLGTGTQLGLAVAAALELLSERGGNDWPTGTFPTEAVVELARKTGRGKRSAVGIHGFALGGLIVESGKMLTPEGATEVSPLAAQVALPAAWRFVLVRPATGAGLAGESERTAFEQLPPTPVDLTARLESSAFEQVLPAAQQGDHAGFAAALEEFGALAGECFAPVQGGLFASPEVALIAEQLRAAGGRGVAQSSWGPTVAAVASDLATAQEIVQRLQATNANLVVEIAAASAGARWQRL